MKRRIRDLSDSEVRATLDTLYTAMSSISGRDAVKLFLRDVLTTSERIMIGRRIIIARMLMARTSYDEIGARLRVGRATIGRVHRWLSDQFPGYEAAIRGMEKEFDRRAIRHAAREPFSYAWLKKKYPIHFLLFPTPKIKNSYGLYEKQKSSPSK